LKKKLPSLCHDPTSRNNTSQELLFLTSLFVKLGVLNPRPADVFCVAHVYIFFLLYHVTPHDEEFPDFREHVISMLSLFSSRYRHEQPFESMKNVKSRTRTRLADEHFDVILTDYSSKHSVKYLTNN
jgi:hypothetical protein